MTESNLSDLWKVLIRENPTPGIELVLVPGAGRGLVCKRELEAGEVVLVDQPIVVGMSR